MTKEVYLDNQSTWSLTWHVMKKLFHVIVNFMSRPPQRARLLVCEHVSVSM